MPSTTRRLIALLAALAGVFPAVIACASLAGVPELSDGLVILNEAELLEAMQGFRSIDEAIAYQPTLGKDESDPLGPVIKVEAPKLGEGPVCSPTEIDVRWSPGSKDAQVDPRSLRVRARLGLLSKDLTEDVHSKGSVDQQGIKVSRGTMAMLPDGVTKVKVMIVVSDDKKRRTAQEFTFDFKKC